VCVAGSASSSANVAAAGDDEAHGKRTVLAVSDVSSERLVVLSRP
jgi:hypothetical protein